MPSGKCKGVAGVGDFRAGGAEDDLDDVQADGDVRMIQEAEPCLGAADEGFLLGGIDGVGGAAEAVGGARFYLDEDEGLLFAAYQVDLAAVRRAEVAVEDLEAVPAQMPGGELLPLAAEAQVRGLRRRGRGGAGRPGEKSCDEWGKGHGF